jgi:hypothetical protein
MKAAALAGQRLCWFELKKQQARPFRFLGVGNRLPPRRPSRRRLVAAPQDEGRFAPRGKPLHGLLRLKTFRRKVFSAFGRPTTKGPKILALPNRI